jgi:glycosyltransferase involved in cell wall biosynthesis
VVEQPLCILQVNSFDLGGGTARVAWTLCETARARGHSGWLAVGQKRSDDPNVIDISERQHAGAWSRQWWNIHERLQGQGTAGDDGSVLSRATRALAEPLGFFDYWRGVENFHYPGSRDLLSLTPRPPDIIHGHNLHGGYFDLRLLPSLSRQVPLVLTLHDAWLLSGHCAHSLGCERWMIGCGSCPDLTIYPSIRRDATAENWRRKRDIYAQSRLFVATPSHWLMQKVERSMLSPGIEEARVIPNGVDLSIFHPADQRAARTELGLPQHADVLLFAANVIRDNVWKDYETLREAILRVAEMCQERQILFIGLGDDGVSERIGRAELRFVAYQDDPAIVARYYQAADIYVHAARADTFPTSVIEALACGIPVVATAVGGIPEQIDDGRTGLLVPAADAQGLAKCIVRLLADDALKQRLGIAAVAVARERFDVLQQVDTYLQWYGELVERRASGHLIERVEHALSEPGSSPVSSTR